VKRRPHLLDEIKQTRPFPNKATEAGLALLRTANIVRRRVEAIVEPQGISLQQYNVLRILRGAHGPLPTMEIAERMVEETPGITRMVNSLERKGLIRREHWRGDRRQVLCQITPAGLKLLEKLDEPVNEFDTKSCGELTDEQLDHLIQFLAEVRAANTP
jgi:DNA-binding MarR family transcriptional regulator